MFNTSQLNTSTLNSSSNVITDVIINAVFVSSVSQAINPTISTQSNVNIYPPIVTSSSLAIIPLSSIVSVNSLLNIVSSNSNVIASTITTTKNKITSVSLNPIILTINNKNINSLFVSSNSKINVPTIFAIKNKKISVSLNPIVLTINNKNISSTILTSNSKAILSTISVIKNKKISVGLNPIVLTIKNLNTNSTFVTSSSKLLNPIIGTSNTIIAIPVISNSLILQALASTTGIGLQGLFLYSDLAQTQLVPNDNYSFNFNFGSLIEEEKIFPFYLKNLRTDTLTNLHISILINDLTTYTFSLFPIKYTDHNQIKNMVLISSNNVDFSSQPILINSLSQNQGQSFWVKFKPLFGISNGNVNVNFRIYK